MSYGDILRFAAPVFIGQGINAIISFFCRIIANELGEAAFNGINIGMMFFLIIVTVVTAVSVGTTVHVAQYWGRDDQQEAGLVLAQSLVLGFLISSAITIIGLWTIPIFFSSMNIDPETAEKGATFMFWSFLFFPLVTPGIFLTAALRGAGDTKTPLRAGLVLALLSSFLFYSLSLGRFGFPRLDVLGSALSTSIAYGIYTLILAYKILFKRTVLSFPKTGWRFNMKRSAEILKIGLPSATEWILLRLGMFVYIFVITFYGDKPLSGYFAGLSFLTFCYALTFGFQTAATTLVGQSIGADDVPRAITAMKRTTILSVLFMTVTSVILFFVTEDILTFLFSKLDPESIHHARTFILTLVVAMPLMGVSFVLVGALRGAGDTIRPLIASTIGVFGGRIGLAYLIYYLYHPPVHIIWCTLFADILIRIIILLPRVRNFNKYKVANLGLTQPHPSA